MVQTGVFARYKNFNKVHWVAPFEPWPSTLRNRQDRSCSRASAADVFHQSHMYISNSPCSADAAPAYSSIRVPAVPCCCLQEGITESFKPKYRLHSIGLCMPWWDSKMTAAAARNAARPLALQGSGAKAKLKQAAQQLAAAAASAANAAAAVPAARSRYGRIMRRALGGLNGPAAAADAHTTISCDDECRMHGGSTTVGAASGSAGAATRGAAQGEAPAAAGLAVLVLEYPRTAGSKAAAGSAELRFLGKYR
jgi:hypothetical protein